MQSRVGHRLADIFGRLKEAAGSESGRQTLCRLWMPERLAGAYQRCFRIGPDEGRVAGGRKRNIGDIKAEQGVALDRASNACTKHCLILVNGYENF